MKKKGPVDGGGKIPKKNVASTIFLHLKQDQIEFRFAKNVNPN
jgi:hypothetical protein